MTMAAIGRAALGFLATVVGSAALAQPAGEPQDLPVIGVPVPGGVNYQPAVTEVAHDMQFTATPAGTLASSGTSTASA